MADPFVASTALAAQARANQYFEQAIKSPRNRADVFSVLGITAVPLHLNPNRGTAEAIAEAFLGASYEWTVIEMVDGACTIAITMKKSP